MDPGPVSDYALWHGCNNVVCVQNIDFRCSNPATPARGTQVRRLQRAFRGTPGSGTNMNRKRPRSMDPPVVPNQQQGGQGEPKLARSEWD